MFVVTKLDKSIDEKFLKEFCKTHFPKLRQATGSSIVGRYVLLQKNPWICALFFIKHFEKRGETEIWIAEDGNIVGRVLGSSVVRIFTGNKFYEEVKENLLDYMGEKGKPVLASGFKDYFKFNAETEA